jgi:hypothetical protein
MRTYQVIGIALAAVVLAFGGCRKERGGVTFYAPAGPAVALQPAPMAPAPPPVYAPPTSPAQTPPPPIPSPEQFTAPQSPPPPAVGPAAATAQPAPEVLTRGPIHEAFAEPVNYNPEPGIVVQRAPPAAIEEVPPDQRPEGAVWIPGYWAWDDDRGDFIWVSGIWRVPPPNTAWVPGYWTQTAAGFQWTPGFWKTNPTREIVYLPAPPASVELGPTIPPPSEDHIWVSGCWLWSAPRYVWRPGYWMVPQPQWVWVPAHYVWTPRGYVFVDGYWDYAMASRGLLFAPVYFARPMPGLYYSPTVVIDTGLLTFSLFTRPAYCHYYFGDYYDAGYVQVGILPWFEFHRRHGWYDPIYEHMRWSRRHDEPRWAEHVRERYRQARDNRDLRPPRTYQAEIAKIATVPPVQRKELELAKPLSQVVAAKTVDMKFEKLTQTRRDEMAKRSKDIEKYRTQRAGWEAPPGTLKPTKELKRPETVAQETPKQSLDAAKRTEKTGRQPSVPALPTPPAVTKRPEVLAPPPTVARTETSPALPRATKGTEPTAVRPTTVTPPTVITRETGRQNGQTANEAPKGTARDTRQPVPSSVPAPSVTRPPVEVRTQTPPSVAPAPRATVEVRPPTPSAPLIKSPAPAAPAPVVKSPAPVVRQPTPPAVVQPAAPREPVRVRIPEPPVVSRPPATRETSPPPRPDAAAPPSRFRQPFQPGQPDAEQPKGRKS